MVNVSKQKTISEILVRGSPAERLARIEKYRLEWEKLHGPTDLTRHYVTMWPAEDQIALHTADPEAYFNAMPPFLQDMLRGIVKNLASEGRLDDLSNSTLRLYCLGKLTKRDSSPPSR